LSRHSSAAGAAVAKPDEVFAGMAPAERAARGKAARRAVPREGHATFGPAADRPDPVAQLQQQAAGRLAELIPIRYGRMLASPLAFLRGAALLMATDLAGTPVSGLTVQACGDAHLANFGIFASPERRLVFDINDFDETLPAPWEWDVKRLAASLEVAGRGSGFTLRQRRAVVLAAAGQYRLAMRRLAGLGNLEVWYAHSELDELQQRFRAILSARERKLARADLASRGDTEMHQLSSLVRPGGSRPRLISAPPLMVPVAELPDGGLLEPHLRRLIAGYRKTLPPGRGYLASQYEVADLARKVVGVGSVGMRCWVALLAGRDRSDLLMLQLKEAQVSALSGVAGASLFANQGQRVVTGQWLMQAASDIFLGWCRVPAMPGRPATDYYVRQLRDWKFSVPTQDMRPASLRSYAALCGRTLARAHARSGDRIAIASYLGGAAAFEHAIAEFAAACADQNERDYASLKAAAADGRVPAERGV
jgi:uncharacterized protein (DUF2252 family)